MVEAAVEAASLVANGLPFEVVYYMRASTPEFCVKASSVRASTGIQWCSGMRFKLPFETDDSRISWFMGTVASVQVADPMHWPNSPCRLLQSNNRSIPVALMPMGNSTVVPPKRSSKDRHTKVEGRGRRISCRFRGPLYAVIFDLVVFLPEDGESMHNAEKRGKRQVMIRPSSKLIIKFLLVMRKHGYIGEFEFVDDRRSGKIVVELNGRLNKCGVVSPRIDVGVKVIEPWTARLLPSRQAVRSFG